MVLASWKSSIFSRHFSSSDEKFFFHDVTSFIHSTVFETLRNEVILIKGARRFGFDNITELLVQKVHETILHRRIPCG